MNILDYKYMCQWVLYNKSLSESEHYNYNAFIFFYREKLDIQIAELAFNHLVAKNDIFRAHFNLVKGNLQLKILPPESCKVAVEVCDLTQKFNWKKSLNDIIDADEKINFDLGKWPLFNLKIITTPSKSKKFVILLMMHHMLSDAQSSELIKEKFSRYYKKLERGEPINSLPEDQDSILDYFKWKQTLNLRYGGEAKKYWLSQVEEIKANYPSIETQFSRLESEKFEFDLGNRKVLDKDLFIINEMFPLPEFEEFLHYEFIVKGKKFKELNKFIKKQNFTLFGLILACWTLVICSEKEAQSEIVMFTVSDREQANLPNLLGWLVTSAYYNFRLRPELSLTEYIRTTITSIYKAINYRFEPFLRTLFENGISCRFNTFIPLYMNYVPVGNDSRLGLFTNSGYKKSQFSNEASYNMSCTLREYNNGILLDLVFKASAFSHDRVKFYFGMLDLVLDKILHEPNIPLQNLIWDIKNDKKVGYVGAC